MPLECSNLQICTKFHQIYGENDAVFRFFYGKLWMFSRDLRENQAKKSGKSMEIEENQSLNVYISSQQG